MKTVEQTRRELFEATCKEHYYLSELGTARHDDDLCDYVETDIQIAWEVFNAAIDAVVIELPDPESPENFGVTEAEDPDEYAALEARMGSQYSAIHKCRKSIESTGLGIKVK